MNILNSVSVWNDYFQHSAQWSVESVAELLAGVLPKLHADLYMGMLFGLPVAWKPEIKHLFEVMGIQHLFSASGYNLSVIVGSVQPWLRSKVSRGVLGACLLGLVAWYCYLASWQTSLVRAFAMFAYALVATNYLYRQYRPLFGLAVSGALIVLVDQSFLTSISFQLSCAATFGIALGAPLLHRASSWLTALESGGFSSLPSSTTGVRAALTSFLGEGLLVSIAAQAFSLPIILYHFGTLSTISLLANLCLFWLVPYLFTTGLAACLVLAILRFLPGSDWLSSLVGWILWVPSELFFRIVSLFSGFDWTLVRVQQFSAWQVWGWWGVVLLCWRFYSARIAQKRSYGRLLPAHAAGEGSSPQ